MKSIFSVKISSCIVYYLLVFVCGFKRQTSDKSA
uniref:Uncharacterized protein n=1 Tax=Myoviridae sp. ctLjW1 TaxID=2825084 RepID=A0A8S5PNK5_9CAUD|nr:MAG TPA: hypothetical protein [Myoviridae sp. ctLjW1]